MTTTQYDRILYDTLAHSKASFPTRCGIRAAKLTGLLIEVRAYIDTYHPEASAGVAALVAEAASQLPEDIHNTLTKHPE